jgi:hypothetical protein
MVAVTIFDKPSGRGGGILFGLFQTLSGNWIDGELGV